LMVSRCCYTILILLTTFMRYFSEEMAPISHKAHFVVVWAV
jgi:hypothetical protein